MITENTPSNYYVLDTSCLIAMAQFGYVLPEFSRSFNAAIMSTNTQLLIPQQVEREHEGLYIYTSPTQARPEILTVRDDDLTMASDAVTGKLNPQYFETLSSGEGTTYIRDQKFTTFTEADPAVAALADDIYQEFFCSSTGLLNNDRKLTGRLTTQISSYNVMDIVLATAHHSSLDIDDAMSCSQLLSEEGPILFHTKKWAGAAPSATRCILCHNIIEHV